VFLKVDEDCADVTPEGKPFQTRGATTPKTRSPTVFSLERRLTSLWLGVAYVSHRRLPAASRSPGILVPWCWPQWAIMTLPQCNKSHHFTLQQSIILYNTEQSLWLVKFVTYCYTISLLFVHVFVVILLLNCCVWYGSLCKCISMLPFFVAVFFLFSFFSTVSWWMKMHVYCIYVLSCINMMTTASWWLWRRRRQYHHHHQHHHRH